ncbi:MULTISPECIES: Ycf66 family protein [unclassified Leptolyngbya]|uniref:Ycf66 family protein n=1 Tax=unclassified Leptolyngbya TaxID=2650499 RepID=UPI00168287FA|nr:MULTISPECIES: Ycf66 family protein [unclassified Leptolyngbya]MBD1912693.1 Ycf66 family protein [Leptolyngbya sp. FACHB-8]MBD2154684.1 Ycf66 family protein [Leptolyngbya sp. FACHB-16]
MVEVGLNWSNFVASGLLTQPVLAQVNLGANPAVFLGVVLAVSGAGLYFLRSIRPQLARDYDIALAAVALLCGFILFFQGWRLDPILTFGYFLLAGAAGFFAFETLRLRGATAEQAKRYTPLVDDERPVSRVYRAELDELSPVDERPTTRRIRASRDYRSSDAEDYGSEDRRPSVRGSIESRSDRSARRRSASSRPSSSSRPSRSSRADDWGDEPPAPSARQDRSFWDNDDDFGSDRSSTSYRSSSSRGPSSRPRRPRPPIDDDMPSSRRPPIDDRSSDYVDYQPVDYGDSEIDNSNNFD